MSTHFRTLILLTALALTACVPDVSAQGRGPQGGAAATAWPSDALIGTWILNVAKSTYEGVPAPKSERRTIDYSADGAILNVTENVSTEGQQSFSFYVAKFDGKEYPEFSRATGAKAGSLISLKPVDATNMEVHVKTNGKADTLSGLFTLSPDGKTLKIQLRGTNPQGQPTNRIRIYDRQ